MSVRDGDRDRGTVRKGTEVGAVRPGDRGAGPSVVSCVDSVWAGRLPVLTVGRALMTCTDRGVGRGDLY